MVARSRETRDQEAFLDADSPGIRRFWTLIFVTAALIGALASVMAEQLPSLEPLKLELDQIEATLGRESLSEDTLGELRDRAGAARDQVRERIDALEPQLNRYRYAAQAARSAPPASAAARGPRARHGARTPDKIPRGARHRPPPGAPASLRAGPVRRPRHGAAPHELHAASVPAHAERASARVLEARLPTGLQREVRSVGYLIEGWWGYAARRTAARAASCSPAATLVALALGATPVRALVAPARLRAAQHDAVRQGARRAGQRVAGRADGPALRARGAAGVRCLRADPAAHLGHRQGPRLRGRLTRRSAMALRPGCWRPASRIAG